MIMNQAYKHGDKQVPSTRSKRPTSNNPVILIPNAQISSQGMKIRKSDLKLLQQYCEQNDLGIMEVANQSNKASKLIGKSKHNKTKSMGATPVGNTMLQNQFSGKHQNNQYAYELPANAQIIKQNPVLDYQKYLHGESIYTQKKAKSQLGYYSQQQTPVNQQHQQQQQQIRAIPSSKTPDALSQPVTPLYNSYKQSRLMDNSNKDLGSLSALQNYPTAAQMIMSSATNRGISTSSQEQRHNLRKKQQQLQNQNTAATNSLATGGGMPSTISSNPRGQASLFLKSEKNTIDDNINTNNIHDQSQYLNEDPLQYSNQYFHPHNRSTHTPNNYPLHHEESYQDSTNLYEQFMQGPHNNSDYQAQLDELNAYNKPSSLRPSLHLHAAQHQQKSSQNIAARHTPTQMMTRGASNNNYQQRASQQQSQFSQSKPNSSKNSQDRRHVLGRTPSPNLFKKTTGGININVGGSDHLYKQHMMLSNATTKNLKVSNFSATSSHHHHQHKRSHSKQQYTSAGGGGGGGQIILGTNIIQSLNKTLKQKFIKQYGSAQGAMKYQSGSITTTFNSAANSPARGTSSTKQTHYKKAPSAMSQLNSNQGTTATQGELFDYINKKVVNQQNSSGDPFHQKQLRMINQQEEQRALAMISGIKSSQKNEPQLKSQLSSLSQQQQQQQQQFQQHQHQHPVQMQLLAENVKDISSQNQLSTEEIVQEIKHEITQSRKNSVQSQNMAHKIIKSSGNGGHQILDGGTGSNGMISANGNMLINSQNSSLGNLMQNDFKRQSAGMAAGAAAIKNNYTENANDQQQMQQYLDSLHNIRQMQNQQNQNKMQQPQVLSSKDNYKSEKYQSEHHYQYEKYSDSNNFQSNPSSSQQQHYPVQQNQNNKQSTSKLDSVKKSTTSAGIQAQKDILKQKTELLDSTELFQRRSTTNQGMVAPPSANNYSKNKSSNAQSKNASLERPKHIQAPSIDQYKQSQQSQHHQNPHHQNQLQHPPQTTVYDSQQRENIAAVGNNQHLKMSQMANHQQPKKYESSKVVTHIDKQQQLEIMNANNMKNRKGSQPSNENSISIIKQLQDSFKENPLSLSSPTLKQSKEYHNSTKMSMNIGGNGLQLQSEHITVKNSASGAGASKVFYAAHGSGSGSSEGELTPLSRIVSVEKQHEITKQQTNKTNQTKKTSQKASIVTKKSSELKALQYDGDEFEEQDLNDINKMIDEEPVVLITQEDQRLIREVASDINEKAFYGKLLKKQKMPLIESNYEKLSPRSREIASIMNIINQSFLSTNEPPITTTDFYRIGKMLGRGAFGKVNLAMHKLVRKLVAIKSLNKEVLTDEGQKAKLMKEVSLLLKLRHNHVVKIYETIETEKHIIIVMELCAGGDLLNYVRKRRKLKEPNAKVIFKQIIDGLCYIHSKYIAHRDIKLDNILLDGKGNVKIADFGVSKQCQKGQKMTEQCGTPAYIAPEILKDRGYSFNVDIWSAGVVLFAMLYGTVPFKANNMEELHKLIIKGKYTLKDDISAEARNLLRGLLEVNPDKRLTIQQIYRHRWLQDVDPAIELFNEGEREMIRKEYTYNDPRRYNRNENEEPVDCFTEHNLESVYNSLKNATSKSVILAPFNSTQSQMESHFRESMQENICEKMMVINFARRCREIDRQYEFNNNGDLDNGVYHKYVYNSDEDGEGDGDNEGGADKRGGDKLNGGQLSEPMLVSEKPKNKKGGRASIENSFENDVDPKGMSEKQINARKIKEGSLMQNEIKKRNNKRNDLELDKDLIKTYETFQSQFNTQIDEEKVQKLVSFGYPREYVITSIEDNDPNHCTSGYYLMGMDQNYC